MDSDTVLRTPRLTLRTYRPSDAEPLLTFYGRAEVCRYLPTEVWTDEIAAETVGKRIGRTSLTDVGALALAVEREGHVIGCVEAWTTDNGSTFELGWTFSPDHSGLGYATEAATALLDSVFRMPDAHRVTAQMDAQNTASARLAGRLGMRQEGHLIQNYFSKGEWTDTRVFAVLRSEWVKRHESAER